MRKHNFLIGLRDEKGNVVGAKCAHCSKIVFYQHGVIPPAILAQKCENEEDQAAARVVREAAKE
jgi:hypothetical protein